MAISQLLAYFPSLSALLFYTLLFFLSYKVIQYTHRIFFHPLASIPGPFLCSFTRLYEFYFDAYKQGRLWARLPELHAQYGPIIRIGPDEVHITDSGYFQYLFGFKPLDKYALAARQFGLKYAMFGTEDYKTYVPRRAAFGNAFSRSKVWKLQGLVNEKIEKGVAKMREYKEEGKQMDLAYLYRAITAEIITEYMYGQQYGFFEDETTTKGLYDRRFDMIFGFTHLGRFIPWMIPMILILLRGQMRVLLGSKESMASFMNFTGFASKMLKSIVDEHGIQQDWTKDKAYNIAAAVYLHSSLPMQDKTGDALIQATMAAWSGGWDTTAFALTQGTYLILRDARVHQALTAELHQAWPHPDVALPYAQLDQLPYLAAVTKESLRLMFGALNRLTRINPCEPEMYNKFVLPAGTKISMSLSDVNLDPAIWGHDATSFRPERWLGHPELDPWLATFSKGTRVCLGEELAWMELKMVFATLLRKFELCIPEEARVTDADVLPHRDGHTPGPKTFMQRLPVEIVGAKT